MSKEFKVSVIMPVYNAAKFVAAAVSSAVHLDEVGEVILIEDKSPDNALQICDGLRAEFPKVKLYRHPNGENRGAGASRNLGIQRAQFNYISFLDADDVYLPNRFLTAVKVFNENPDADGVYGAAGFIGNDTGKLYSINNSVPPEKLFSYLVRGTFGHFHTNAITLKKSVFEKAGYFNPELRLGQDADLWLRIAFHCRLFSGEISKAICLIRRHDENRIHQINDSLRINALKVSLEYFKSQPLSLRDYLILVAKLYKIYAKHRMGKAMLADSRFFLAKLV